MKQVEPNLLKRALAEGGEGPHPDADVLTAFAENALLPRERETVLTHLARCAVCRQVMHYADASAEKPLESKPFLVARRPAWRIIIPALAAAAVLAVVSSVAVRYGLKQPQQSAAIATKPAEEKADHAAAPQSSPPGEEKKAVRKTRPAPVEPAPATVAGLKPPAAESAQRQSEASETVLPPPANSSIGLQKMAAGVPASANAFAGAAATRATAMTASARPHWRINEQGQPERAFGQGPWQPVPPNQAARMQVVSTLGGEVWIGGEKSQVYRSVDSGTSWQIVSLPLRRGIAHTIVHIQFASAKEVVIQADDGTTWTSADGGQTWK